MADQLKNFAYGTVATAPSPAGSGTEVVLTAGHGARFPATARVENQKSQSLLAKSCILQYGKGSLVTKGRIQKVATASITTKGRIQIGSEQELVALARIGGVVGQEFKARASILQSAQHSIFVKGFISTSKEVRIVEIIEQRGEQVFARDVVRNTGKGKGVRDEDSAIRIYTYNESRITD